MVDRPRDRTRPARGSAVDEPATRVPAAEAPVATIEARHVVAFLRRHPEFLDEHPEALRLLRPPGREIGDGVVDFQQFLFERQRRELDRLNAEYRALIGVTRGNLASQARVHKAALTVLAAPSFGQLLQIVTTDLAVLLDVDVVTIAIENIAGITPRLNVQGIHLVPAGAVEAQFGEDKSVLYEAEVEGDPMLFGAAAGLVRSQALLRLRFGRETPTGLLCIGTRKPGRFHPGLGTELLGFLARIVGISIGLWLNPVR
ncbi:MAG: DUF484 family protein [Alphaproteobacteria bacterium]|nr:DUF484 family protein [Alphaproteobacteria bacterium]